nr:unnamed protein product [Digitaria exilis]
MRVYDAALGEREYLAGDLVNLADVAHFGFTHYLMLHELASWMATAMTAPGRSASRAAVDRSSECPRTATVTTRRGRVGSAWRQGGFTGNGTPDDGGGSALTCRIDVDRRTNDGPRWEDDGQREEDPRGEDDGGKMPIDDVRIDAADLAIGSDRTTRGDERRNEARLSRAARTRDGTRPRSDINAQRSACVCFSSMVNAEPCSMGGIIDYGVGVGTKSSPRSLAIEKAQEELRQERDIREERRRELEFLEKGGNPLDFRFVHVETVSVHSASLTNQIEAQNVIRSKPTRESANVASVISSLPPANGYETKDDNGVLSISSIKQPGSNCDNAPKNAPSDGQEEMEVDGIQTIHERECVVNEEVKQADNHSRAQEVSSNDANHNGLSVGCGEIAAEVACAETPDTSLKVPRPCYPSASTHDERVSCVVDEKADNGHLDEHVAYIHAGELDSRRKVPVSAVEASTSHKNVVGPPCEATMNIVDDHADGDTNLVAAKIDVKSHEDLANSRCYSTNENTDLVQPEANNILHIKEEMEVCDSAIVAQKDTGCLSSGQTMNIEESPASDMKNTCDGDSNPVHPIYIGIDLPKALPSPKNDESNLETEIKNSTENINKMANKAYEDSILTNARVIEACIKRASKRSHCNIALEKRSKSHWDFVLEEMAWMANDFVQERLWKSVAASKVCHWIASDGRAKFEEANIQRKQKTVMKTIAKGIMSFWRSAEALQTAETAPKMIEANNSTMLEGTQPSGTKAEKEQVYKPLETKESRQPRQSQIQDYAVRFLEYNCRAADSHVLPEAPPTPDRLNDFGILKVSDHLAEENLFYTVAPGTMLAYRESLESLFVYHKEAGNAELNDDYEASVCDSAAVCSDMLPENAYDEDEVRTCTYVSHMGHKKKHLMHQRISVTRQYEIGTNVPYEPCLESKSGNRPLLSNGKRPTSFLAMPPKRIRTAARRVVSPFHAGACGPPQVTSKTDASSGDTNSYQDDQSSLHGGSLPWRNTDFESTVDSDRQLPYDASEACTKANKKKKVKNPGYKIAQNTIKCSVPASVKFQGRMYDPRLQVDLTNKYEQKEYLKKRSDIHQYDSNGNSVAYGGQHASKKLKMVKQGIAISQEASPATSQMSNMANSTRLIKIIANRDRGRKCKALKVTSIGGWSNFEDQALVVLVHDMGQNWELVSDAINSIVKFKYVHRRPKECKERHKVLVDRSSGDGADSAEDSGSSQHYHNPLPGIPKACSFTILFCGRRQGNRQELKPIIQPHSSHVIALSQACPNRISGGTLMPLDLCDVTSPNLDSVTPGSVYPGSHGITLANHQVSVGPSTPTSNPNSRLPGSPGVVLGSNSPSPSTLNAPRDTQKYGVPRPTLQGDEQKIQFNQMVNGRNLQQPGGSVPGAFPAGVDRGARIMPAAHGMGTVAGLNRGMPAGRPGFPRINSPAMLNAVSSGNMLTNSGQGVPNSVSVHPGAISGPGNTILRPRNSMQTLSGMEEHRHTQEFDMQVAQGSIRSLEAVDDSA